MQWHVTMWRLVMAQSHPLNLLVSKRFPHLPGEAISLKNYYKGKPFGSTPSTQHLLGELMTNQISLVFYDPCFYASSIQACDDNIQNKVYICQYLLTSCLSGGLNLTIIKKFKNNNYKLKYGDTSLSLLSISPALIQGKH